MFDTPPARAEATPPDQCGALGSPRPLDSAGEPGSEPGGSAGTAGLRIGPGRPGEDLTRVLRTAAAQMHSTQGVVGKRLAAWEHAHGRRLIV